MMKPMTPNPFSRAALAAVALMALGPLALSACATVAPAEAPAAFALPEDVHSYARPAEARVTHVDLDLAADFEARTLSGAARLDLARAPDAKALVLDVKDLAIAGVEGPGGTELPFALGAADPILGQALTFELPSGVNQVTVRYATKPEAAALQWLEPSQTLGGKEPFLFSQGQAILTRTWVPTQDSPGIRQTYSARIVVPEGLKAVMSAQALTPEGEPAGQGRRAFRFQLDKAVPPYLIAIAVGDLAFRPLGDRAGVYAEPGLADVAAAEFADLPDMIEAAEALYGPYRWGRYDVLVLPPSFPFGGMENPRLTFATPTIIAGDRSLVSLIAHELAHSWSGNLVTNATWSDFWLNEGFTDYFENRIMERLYGPERAAMLAQLGYESLKETVSDLPAADTRLKIDLAGRDPDAGFTDIAYQKGAAFLRAIERSVGRERFDAYLRDYFDRFAFQPMTTERFLADVRAKLYGGALPPIDLDRWAYQPGLPEGAEPPPSDAFAKVEAQAQAFAGGAAAASLKTEGWSTQEWQRFLASLPETLTPAQLADVDAAFGFSRAGNSEIAFSWLMIAVENRYDPAVPALEKFLTQQGRRKFVRPLFAALVEEEGWGRPIAERIYAEARPLYHTVTAASVDEVLKEG